MYTYIYIYWENMVFCRFSVQSIETVSILRRCCQFHCARCNRQWSGGRSASSACLMKLGTSALCGMPQWMFTLWMSLSRHKPWQWPTTMAMSYKGFGQFHPGFHRVWQCWWFVFSDVSLGMFGYVWVRLLVDDALENASGYLLKETLGEKSVHKVCWRAGSVVGPWHACCFAIVSTTRKTLFSSVLLLGLAL